MLARLFGSPERRRDALKRDVEIAKKQDADEFSAALEAYRRESQERKEAKELARRILAKEPEALVQVLQEANPFSEIGLLGSHLTFSISDNGVLRAEINVHGENIIPAESKSLTKTGKLSVREMPRTKFYELYQDYVCSCVLRVAREVFALLPIAEIQITAVDELLNTATGHLEEQPILSVFIPRDTLGRLNIDSIDPSDSMTNFLHNMDFKKSKGFSPVKEVAAPAQ